MRHWLQLATRSWQAKPGRAVAALFAVALGVGTVVSVCCFYESIRRAVTEQVVSNWLGTAHLNVISPGGHWSQMDGGLTEQLRLQPEVAEATHRLMRRSFVYVENEADRVELDGIGVDPLREAEFRPIRTSAGRSIEAGDEDVLALEDVTARSLGVDVGDELTLSEYVGGKTRRVRIVGLLPSRRVADFQEPTGLMPIETLQNLHGLQGRITSVDVILKDDTEEGLAAGKVAVERVLKELGTSANVSTSAAQLNQLQEADQVMRLVLMVVSFVALLTSFFIILTTMSMGIVERVGQLGMMRCIGVTRRQLGALILAEVGPLGVFGVILGLPLGIGLTRLGAWWIEEFIADVRISWWGIALGVCGGLLTTLVGASVLMIQVGRVAPLEASRPHARPMRWRWILVAAVVGGVLLCVHEWMIRSLPVEMWFRPEVLFASMTSLYGGYVLLAPLMVSTLAVAAVGVVAWVMRVRPKLARDQIGRAPWRAAGVCWMLMVGVSLIVFISVRSESILAAWDFPSKLPQTFVWAGGQAVSDMYVSEVRSLPGVSETTLVRDFPCQLGEGDVETGLLARLRRQVSGLVPTMYVAGEMDTFLAMTKMGFLEGNEEDALEKLKAGGALLLPPESARTLGLSAGDMVTLRMGGVKERFEIAGVVQSPALDIATQYFGAGSYMSLAASHSVLGTLKDAREKFGVYGVTMFMLNVSLPEVEAPKEFHADAAPPEDLRELLPLLAKWRDSLLNLQDDLDALLPNAMKWANGEFERLPGSLRYRLQTYVLATKYIAKRWDRMNPAERWDAFREEAVLRRIAVMIQVPQSITGSLRQLKQQIDNDIRHVARIATAIPVVALMTAALGVANLMMVNVHSRTRQIAVIRAVGGTKSEILRMVLAEAATLAVPGCLVGLALGMHLAHSDNRSTERMFGIQSAFTVPWWQVGLGLAFTALVCLLAGLGPARHAARNNVVDAMRSI